MDDIILGEAKINLCIMSTTCYMIIILRDQGLARRGFLANLSQFPD